MSAHTSKAATDAPAWRTALPRLTSNACRGCPLCNGKACRGEVPGMGGAGDGSTFEANVQSWEGLAARLGEEKLAAQRLPDIGVAPMTGVAENMGDPLPEADFHRLLLQSAARAGVFSCIGDGTPDYKLYSGRDALQETGRKGIAFIKPYSNARIRERIARLGDTLLMAGIDIDSWQLATMTGKSRMEQKDATRLKEIASQLKVPFIIKGICHDDELELLAEVKPDVVVISNHGGRIKPGQEGIASVLARLAPLAGQYCGEIWVDSGLRRREHLLAAAALGVKRVLIGRPFIQGVIALGAEGIPVVLRQEFAIGELQSSPLAQVAI